MNRLQKLRKLKSKQIERLEIEKDSRIGINILIISLGVCTAIYAYNVGYTSLFIFCVLMVLFFVFRSHFFIQDKNNQISKLKKMNQEELLNYVDEKFSEKK